MSVISYPASLPGPTAASLAAMERRQLAGRPFDARTFSRDRLDDQDVTLGPFTPAELAVFEDFWKNTLKYGGCWFAATWPYPQAQAGWATVARRFKGPLRRKATESGFWTISGTCECQPRRAAPNQPVCPIWYTPTGTTSGNADGTNGGGTRGCDVIDVATRALTAANPSNYNDWSVTAYPPTAAGSSRPYPGTNEYTFRAVYLPNGNVIDPANISSVYLVGYSSACC